MTDNNKSQFSDEVIDLRELIQVLWSKKWIILGLTLLAGLAAILVSSYLVAERYQSAAFITVVEPSLRAELETSIQMDPVQLETSGLPSLAESAELMEQVFDGLGLTDPIQQRTFEFVASMQGEGQLRLVVTAEDPDLSAEAANAWAEVMSGRMNELYGTSQSSLTILEGEVAQARLELSTAQETLEDYLPESQLNALEVELREQKNNLSRYLTQVEGNRLLISDAEALLAQLASEDIEGNLATGTALSIIAIQQRAAGGVSGTQFQLQGDQIMGVDYSAEEGQAALLGLISALEMQNQDFEKEALLIQSGLGEISSQLESERYRVEQLTQERDLAQLAYTALSSQLEETRITRAHEDSPVRIGAKAVAPQQKISPNGLLITALATLMTLFFTMLAVLLVDWYQKGEQEDIF